MQTTIGRLTANATIKETKDGRKLVAFTIAQNDRFKVKGSDEVKQVTNYFSCSYWIATGISEHLKKGILVEATGRVGLNVWKNMDGEAKASLTLHVQHIQLHSKGSNVLKEAELVNETEKADLPF